VRRRSAAQLPDEEKAAQADYIIDNSGSLEHAERQVEKIWAELQQSK
jgi:dephospho-CoA kinase